jgi:hypothetical protein
VVVQVEAVGAVSVAFESMAVEHQLVATAALVLVAVDVMVVAVMVYRA